MQHVHPCCSIDTHDPTITPLQIRRNLAPHKPAAYGVPQIAASPSDRHRPQPRRITINNKELRQISCKPTANPPSFQRMNNNHPSPTLIQCLSYIFGPQRTNSDRICNHRHSFSTPIANILYLRIFFCFHVQKVMFGLISFMVNIRKESCVLVCGIFEKGIVAVEERPRL
ncbi:unnamed protein product [Vicia faba]|uniref:Uncharacterized protein n=1 Tax=Vicia faba TaxID=3906 RepID=A0AAV0ZFC3_VICFA|nr:unnamed protein product [Vicia faba]